MCKLLFCNPNRVVLIAEPNDFESVLHRHICSYYRVVKSRPFRWTLWDLISEEFCTVVNGERQYFSIPFKLYCQSQICLSV